MSGKDWRNNFKDIRVCFHLGGIEDFRSILEIQRSLNLSVENDGTSAHILVLEHSDTYTTGIHTEHIDQRIPNPVKLERGGSITYHGPGQIVAYYIFNMKKLDTNILGIIELAHESEIEYLKLNGVEAEQRLHKETGIWCNNKKIGSTGFSIRGSTTMHGTALNVQTDLLKFDQINPCGYSPEIMTSLHEITGKSYNMEKEKKILVDVIKEKIGNPESETLKISGQWSGTVP
ncbi:MAG: lipoyl(octanoyl) transferase LipB [Candidatus Thermoplasmatota archaeon]|jgi:lipoyl(octanoyl) transferase|nr:lipoyl(octanoyl) transferase LipB [Candidatus Thermoplasmatota archaeon]MCL5988270.1 lipoyl(octanoyl) transferase LipB [Candidatus Thermoplasmatota archaeon]